MGKIQRLILGVVMILTGILFTRTDVEAATKIHYISLNGSTDAILLEDDGKFGLVDSGEDWDYSDGSSKYPLRSGIVKNKGFEQQVVYYMKSVGVTSDNLEFYVGTHAHSDHIGSGDEIVRTFKPKTLYLKKYKDSNIKNSSRRWDNRYVYDTLLKAAKENGVNIVQDLSEGMKIKLGKNTKLQLYNTKVRKSVTDENANSLVIKVTSYKTKTLLTADMEPDVAKKLLKKGFIGKVSILKLPHHGYYQNNPTDILKCFVPKTAIVTGPSYNMVSTTVDYLKSIKADVRSVYNNGAAIVTEFTSKGYTTTKRTVKSGWFTWENNRYYMDKSGRPVTGWKKISGEWYYFTKTGQVKTGWLQKDGLVYYLKKKDGDGLKQGAMLAGWQTIGGKNYYFKKSTGAMLSGWQTIGGKVYYLKKSGSLGEKGQLLTGITKVSGRTYYFKDSGKHGTIGSLQTGWEKIGDSYYYFKKTGTLGENKGIMLTGWQQISGKQFYFKKSGTKGVMLTGIQTIDNATYYFATEGKTGVLGSMQTGEVILDDTMYVFANDGCLKEMVPVETTPDIEVELESIETELSESVEPNQSESMIEEKTDIVSPENEGGEEWEENETELSLLQ